jgi:hypothetical protein
MSQQRGDGKAFRRGQSWTGPYTNDKPGFDRYRGVDDIGNPPGALSRALPERLEHDATNADMDYADRNPGYAAKIGLVSKLPKK